MTVDPAVILERFRGTLAELLGIRFVEASPDCLVAELPYREELTTVGGSLHGGTLMAFADTVGAAATMLNLPPGASTTTVESKTNFFAAGRSGIVRAEATDVEGLTHADATSEVMTDAGESGMSEEETDVQATDEDKRTDAEEDGGTTESDINETPEPLG